MTPKRVSIPSAVVSPTEVQTEVTHARDWLDERRTQCNTDGMALRHCRAKGIRRFRGDNGGLAKSLGRSHDLAR